MPLFKIETNQNIQITQDILVKTSEFIANLLNKPEKYVMVSIDPNSSMMFDGTTKPVAFIKLKSIGLPTDKCSELSKNICEFVESEFGISSDRIFIDFYDLERKMFGWNKGTF